jgi:ferrochelatase
MKAILLINVGTPADCTKADVQKFIGEMLSDPLVVGQPKWLSGFLAKKIIAPLSAAKSLKKYRQIWRTQQPEISPMAHYMQKLANSLEAKTEIPVEPAMRYGKPSIFEAFERLEKRVSTLSEVVVFPLFPHFAQSTTQTATEEIERVFEQHSYPFCLKFVPPYFDHPAFINALAAHAKPYLKDVNKLIFSYHSLPVGQVKSAQKKGKMFDYVHQLTETNRLLCEKLNIDYQLFYTSQRGNGWLKPFLDAEIDNLPKQGYKKIAVMSPGFPADNMETLYDIDIQARKAFLDAGGEKFVFIPALNDSELWVEAIGEIIGK